MFLPILLTRKISAITITTINIPTPIPVLKIPPIIAQLEKVMSREINNAAISVCFFMIAVSIYVSILDIDVRVLLIVCLFSEDLEFQVEVAFLILLLRMLFLLKKICFRFSGHHYLIGYLYFAGAVRVYFPDLAGAVFVGFEEADFFSIRSPSPRLPVWPGVAPQNRPVLATHSHQSATDAVWCCSVRSLGRACSPSMPPRA